MDGDAFEKKYNTLGIDMIQAHQTFCQEVLKLLPGQMAVVSNGRVSKNKPTVSKYPGELFLPCLEPVCSISFSISIYLNCHIYIPHFQIQRTS